jgi:lipid-A-disaccharide synthase
MASNDKHAPAPSPAPAPASVAGREYRFFVVVGEHSGDALGAKLMAELNRRLRGRVRYLGVGGEHMQQEGLTSQFPLDEVAVMGPMSILPRLPRIVRRVYGTVHAAIAAEPDAVIIIDSPEFTHPIAKRIRQARPHIPIIDYVSPSVWAWRPGRARKMRRYVDHVLALLPFEVEAHQRLGGPKCTYVGHPLGERLDEIDRIKPRALAERLGLNRDMPALCVLPGSRVSEVTRLLPVFGDTVARVNAELGGIEVIIPVVPSVRGLIEEGVKGWPCPVHLVEGEADKFATFRHAVAALAASGTVTLELGLCATPSVVAYKVDKVAATLRFLVKVPSIVLANLVAGDNIYPEFIQEDCTAAKLSAALLPLLTDTPERAAQVEKLAKVRAAIVTEGQTPSERAADVVMQYADAAYRAAPPLPKI